MEHTLKLHERRDWHVSRSWSGTRLEDGCPCPKAPCGMVSLDRTSPDCTEHPAGRFKSIRRSHLPEHCLGVDHPRMEVM